MEHGEALCVVACHGRDDAQGTAREPPNTALCVCGGECRGGPLGCAGDRPGGVRSQVSTTMSERGVLAKQFAGLARCENAGGRRQVLRSRNRAPLGVVWTRRKEGGTRRGCAATASRTRGIRNRNVDAAGADAFPIRNARRIRDQYFSLRCGGTANRGGCNCAAGAAGAAAFHWQVSFSALLLAVPIHTLVSLCPVSFAFTRKRNHLKPH